MDVTGPWIIDETYWANGWFNLNVQITYWFLSAANRQEVADSLYSKLDASLDVLVANMPEKFEGECAGFNIIVPQTLRCPGPGRPVGNLVWLCHDYWMMLERTMDQKRITQKFFPLLKKAVNTYLYLMEEEGEVDKDGKIHLPAMGSPEYGAGRDTSYNLSLFRWGLTTLTAICQRYGLEDELLPTWIDTLSRLADFRIDENGFMVAAEVPFAKSHRHYSHLLMIYPLCLVNVDQPENRELIARSVDHWINYPGEGNAGYSWSGVAAMSALQGDGEAAAKYIDNFMEMNKSDNDMNARIHTNTMYTEGNPVSETPFSLCDSIQQMVFQSWGGTIRIFPAVPGTWKNISFSDFMAVGGFLVSAERRDGKTTWVKIKSTKGEPCRLRPGFTGVVKAAGSRELVLTALEEGLYELDLQAGEEVILYTGDTVPDTTTTPVEADKKSCNHFGLKAST